MSDLDAAWARHLFEAEERAHQAGRAALADYLRLRASNDAARSVGIGWLLDTFAALADEELLRGAALTVRHEDGHRFRTGQSTMVGLALTLRAGVRSLTVEAGWPRTPADGVVRGGGLARARLSHFGDRAPDEELLLTREGADAAPRWVSLAEDGRRTPFDEDCARRHLAKFLG